MRGGAGAPFYAFWARAARRMAAHAAGGGGGGGEAAGIAVHLALKRAAGQAGPPQAAQVLDAHPAELPVAAPRAAWPSRSNSLMARPAPRHRRNGPRHPAQRKVKV